MSDEIVIEKLKAQFPEGVLGVQEFRGETTLRQAQDTAVTVRAEELVDVCTFLRDDPELQYTTLTFVTGLDGSELGPVLSSSKGPVLSGSTARLSSPKSCRRAAS